MEALGINGLNLLAQVINFGVILLLLIWLLKKPLERILCERAEKIAQSLKDAEDLKSRLAKLEDEKASVIAEAKKQADDLIAKGQTVAAELSKKAAAEAKKQAEEILARAKKASDEDRTRLVAELKDQIKTVVQESLATSFKELPEEERRRLADDAIENLTKSA